MHTYNFVHTYVQYLMYKIVLSADEKQEDEENIEISS